MALLSTKLLNIFHRFLTEPLTEVLAVFGGDGFRQQGRDGRWRFDREEVERFAESRQRARLVLGYDVTWSAPKSVSMLYARGSEDDRRAVEASFEAAIAAGMDYLAAEGFHVRSGRGREKAGVIAPTT